MKTIAIPGANGRLANLAVQAFHQAGYKVLAITRDGQLREAPAGVVVRAADARDAKALTVACHGADFILHALNPPYHRWPQLAMPLTRSVITAATAVGATVLFPGNVYNYGTSIPAVINAQTPFHPDHSKAAVRVEMEALMADQATHGGPQVLILRAGDFYGGKGRGAWFDMALAKQVSKGKFEYPGDPEIDHAWAYLPDLARAFVDLASIADQCGQFEAFLFEGHCLQGEEFRQLLAEASGRPLKPVQTAWWLFKLLGWIVPMIREVNAMRYLWDRPHRIDGADFRSLVPDLQITPKAVAVKQAWADYQASA